MARFHDTDPASIRRRLAEIAAVEATRRRIPLRAGCAMLASIAGSLLLMAWGFGMSDADRGPVIFYCGAILGNLGIVVTLLWAHHASEE